MKYSVVAVTIFLAFILFASNAFAEIELLYLDATGMDGAVRITWGTESEIDTRGFNIWRSEYEDGEYENINEALIPAEGGPDDYEYGDNEVINGTTYWYKLQEVGLNGTYHGPVSATPTSGDYSAVANAEASTYGSHSLTGSGMFNELALILVPIGAVIVLRLRRRKR